MLDQMPMLRSKDSNILIRVAEVEARALKLLDLNPQELQKEAEMMQLLYQWITEAQESSSIMIKIHYHQVIKLENLSFLGTSLSKSQTQSASLNSNKEITEVLCHLVKIKTFLKEKNQTIFNPKKWQSKSLVQYYSNKCLKKKRKIKQGKLWNHKMT